MEQPNSTKFHFCGHGQSVNEEFLYTMQQIQQLSLQEGYKPILQAAVRILSGETQLNSVESLQEALKPLLENLPQYQLEDLVRMVKILILFLQQSISHNCSVNQLTEDLQQLGWQTEDEKTAFIVRLWKKYYVAMSRSLQLKDFKVSPLRDLDWRFGVTAACSELNQVGNTFLQLKIGLENSDQDVFVEMSMEQFYCFLHEMEKAKKTLDFFGS